MDYATVLLLFIKLTERFEVSEFKYYINKRHHYLTSAVGLESSKHWFCLDKELADLDRGHVVVSLVQGDLDGVLEGLGKTAVDVRQLLDVEKDGGEEIGGEESGHLHGTVKLFLDDAQVATVFDLSLDDLGNDLLALTATLGTRQAHWTRGIIGSVAVKQSKVKVINISMYTE